MKKLQKSNLDELAEKMPIASQKEKAECIGGNFYFIEDQPTNPNTTISQYGYYGTGSEMRVITSDYATFNAASLSEKYNLYSKNIEHPQVSMRTKQYIAREAVGSASWIAQPYGAPVKWFDLTYNISCDTLVDENGYIAGDSGYVTPGVPSPFKVLSMFMRPDSFSGNVDTLNYRISEALNNAGIAHTGRNAYLSKHSSGRITHHNSPWR